LCADRANVQNKVIKLQVVDIPKVTIFKYLGSTVQEYGSSNVEIGRRIKAGWYACKKVNGILCAD